jgi:rfaE bifunctional protein nucleotidyltransferase chain/domain
MNPPDPAAKILSREATDAWVAAQRAAGKRIGFTCGSFDLLHAGHAQYLARARARCDALLVAVNTDASVAGYKNPHRPINPWRERAYLIAAQGAVDAVTELAEQRPLNLLLRWKPDLYLKGGDYAAGSLKSAGAVEAYGGQVAMIASDFATSTTRMLERIRTVEAHERPLAAPERETRGLALLDRDGTLIRDVPFLHDPARVELLPGVAEGLRLLAGGGMRLCVVTNQQGIGLGYYTVQDFIAVNQQMLRLLGAEGIAIHRIYYCPHSLAEDCACRKPRGAMVARAVADSGLAPERCVLIGNTAADAEAARAAGIAAITVGEAATPDFLAAARAALARAGGRG